MRYGPGMAAFILKIPGKTWSGPHDSAYKTLAYINSELRGLKYDGKPEEIIADFSGDYTPRMKSLQIFQHHGIRDKKISPEAKHAFKRDMPKIIEMFPDMLNPFTGSIEFHSVGYGLQEVRFLQK